MSLRVIGANLIVSIKSFYREKTAVFFRIAFPVLLILVFGTIFMNQDNVRFDFYVQDLDGTNSSAELVKTLELNEKFKITKVDPAIDAAQYAKKNKLNLVVVIPKDYEKFPHTEDETQRPQSFRYRHIHIRPQLYFGGHEDANPELGFRRDKPEDVRQAAVHHAGQDIDTQQKIPVHRFLRPRHHRDDGDDGEPVRCGKR